MSRCSAVAGRWVFAIASPVLFACELEAAGTEVVVVIGGLALAGSDMAGYDEVVSGVDVNDVTRVEDVTKMEDVTKVEDGTEVEDVGVVWNMSMLVQ